MHSYIKKCIYVLSKLINGMWFINIFNAYFEAIKNITIDGETLWKWGLKEVYTFPPQRDCNSTSQNVCKSKYNDYLFR